jgi:murein DD-endopeptidase MepM/ murein hydrolase activator NlpD
VRALLPLNGRFALAQRFAIDWEQIDAQNRLVSGDLKDVKNYVIFGKDVLAVGDGTVVASRNDLPEQVPGSLPKDLPVDQADGNFVIQDIGNGAYVLYAHMQPGSVKVTSGAAVKRGDVLGQVGNTGNTSAPHLHLHVMDGPEPLLANGIPYVFESFTLTAIDKAGTADFDKAEETGSPLSLTSVSPPPLLRNVLPLDLTVVEFSR